MKKILFIYHSNICNQNCGSNSYMRNIFSLLHEMGFVVDIFVPQDFDGNWDVSSCPFIDKIFLDKDIIVASTDNKKENFFQYCQRRTKKIIQRIFNFLPKNNKEKVSTDTINNNNKLDWIRESDCHRFQSVLKENKYSYVVFSYIYYSKLLDFVPENMTKVYLVNDFLSIQQMQAGKYSFGEVIDEEIREMKRFDEAIFISSDEMEFFGNFLEKTRVNYLPHFLNNPAKNTNNERDIDVLFLASNNNHNIFGINWFLREVYPLIEKENYKINIVGKIVQEIEQKKYPKIQFIDYIEKLDDIYNNTKLTISPLKSGTGIKIKIVESLSYNVPVVCTSKSLVGFMEKMNNGCLVADEPNNFANGIKKILKDDKFRNSLSEQGEVQFERYFNSNQSKKILSKIFE